MVQFASIQYPREIPREKLHAQTPLGGRTHLTKQTGCHGANHRRLDNPWRMVWVRHAFKASILIRYLVGPYHGSISGIPSRIEGNQETNYNLKQQPNQPNQNQSNHLHATTNQRVNHPGGADAKEGGIAEDNCSSKGSRSGVNVRQDSGIMTERKYRR